MKKIRLAFLTLLMVFSLGFITNAKALESFNVTFKSDGEEILTVAVLENETLPPISDPVKADYTFLGWNLGDTNFNLATPITSDITLDAVWQKNPEVAVEKYTVSFSSDSNIIASVEVDEGNPVSAITSPTKLGYDFVEWQLNGSAYNFSTLVNSNITLIALWQTNGKHVVTFVSDNEVLNSLEVNNNSKVTSPTNPTKDGYTFKEWQLNDVAYDFNTKVTTDLTLVALWEANPGQIYIDKEATSDDRSAEVTISVDGNSFQEAETTDLILVLDRSKSMDSKISSSDPTIRIAATKEAAIALINKLFPEGITTSGIRVGIVVFGTDTDDFDQQALTSDKQVLLDFINNIPNTVGNQGTNIQQGLKDANQILNSLGGSESNKYVILLSDGAPTYFTGFDDSIQGRGSSDAGVCYVNGTWYDSWDEWGSNYNKKYDTKSECTNAGGTWYTPSSEAIAAADQIKQPNPAAGKIFTVAFATDDDAEDLLKEIASEPEVGEPANANFFSASSRAQLLEQFNLILNKINIIATNVVVTDIIPDKFSLDTTDFIARYGSAVVVNEATTQYGDNLVVENLSDGTTKITWNIGSFNVNAIYKLIYKLIAKAPYYGSMYTNIVATLTGTAVDANPYYEDNKTISLVFDKPYVPIVSVTEDDSYTVGRGSTLVVPTNNGILVNDYKYQPNALQSDPNAVVLVEDEIIVINGSLTHGTVLINSDGSLTYIAPDDYFGLATLEYLIRTKITENEKVIFIDSHTSTVTFNIIASGKVIARYVYIKNGSYVDIDTDETTTSTGLIGNSYTTENKSFNTYTYLGLGLDSAPISGNYIDGILTVIRVYDKQDGVVTDSITKTSNNVITNMVNDAITNLNSTVTYKIVYNSVINNYIGDVTLTLVDTLPYQIDTTKVGTDLTLTFNGVNYLGVYNNVDKTITWTININDIDTFNNLLTNNIIAIDDSITVTYINIDATKRTMQNKIKGSLYLKETDQLEEVEGQVSNDMAIYGTLVVKHLEKGTNNVIQINDTKTELVGTSYTASEAVIPTWTYLLGEAPLNKVGNYILGETLVTFYYTRQNGTVTSNITKTSNDIITNINKKSTYTINYSGEVSNYIGDATLTVTDALPYAIDETIAGTDLAGGTLSSDKKTITWTLSITGIDTPANGNKIINFNKVITVTYANIPATDRIIRNNVEGSLTLLTTNQTDKVTGYDDNEVKIYGTLVVKHLEKGTNNVIRIENTKTELVGTSYTTSEAVIPTWAYVSSEAPLNKTGSYTLGEVVVIYYYTKENGQVEHQLNKTSDDVITNTNKKSTYTVNYSLAVSNYIGDATLTVTDTLPYAIDESAAGTNLAGGTLSLDKKTITWIVDLNDVNTFDEENGVYLLNFSKTITVTFASIDPTLRKILNTVTGNVYLKETDQEFEKRAIDENEVVIKGRVIARYVDEKGNTLNPDIILEELIGTPYQTSALQIDDYELINVSNQETGLHQEEDIVVIYTYQQKTGPVVKTGIFNDYKTEIFFLVSSLMMIGTVILKKKFIF